MDIPASIVLSAESEFILTTELNKKSKTLKMRTNNKEQVESLIKQLEDAKMQASVAEHGQQQIGDMYKSLYERYEAIEMRKALLDEENGKLRSFCKAFHFVLPEPTKNIKDSVTSSELYKTQYRMAMDQYLAWFNTNPQ